MKNQIEIYKDKSGETSIEVQFENETVWLNRHQLSQLFNRDIKTIGKHLSNIFKEGELDKSATVAKFATVQNEAGRQVKRNVEHYNLDVIISVGYRVKSLEGTQFRIWATQRLKDYLLQGYAINTKRLAQKEQEVKILKSGIQILNRAIDDKSKDDDMAWLNVFSKGLELLDDYDHEALDKKGKSKQTAVFPSLEEYQDLIRVMTAAFDSSVFGKEKDDNFRSSIAQIGKGFGEEDFYPSLEEKAAMLLYLITKNHSFVDGNKRIAAACFLLFLERNGILYTATDELVLSNDGLAGMTLLIASSKPEEMETVRRLIVSVLNRGG